MGESVNTETMEYLFLKVQDGLLEEAADAHAALVLLSGLMRDAVSSGTAAVEAPKKKRSYHRKSTDTKAYDNNLEETI